MLKIRIGLVEMMKFWIAPLIFLALFTGCSSDEKKREPVDLKDFTSEVNIQTLWLEDVGSGSDGQHLFLQPFYTGSYVFTIDAEGLISAVERASGKVIEEWDRNEPVIGGLGGDSNALYYTTRNGELVALTMDFANLADGAVDAESKIKEAFRVPLSSESLVPPKSNNARIFVQTIDGKLVALDATNGQEIWRYSADEPLLSVRGTSVPQLSADSVITGFSNGEVVALDQQTGWEKWSRPIGEARGRTELERLIDVDASVLLEENRLFSVSLNGKLKMVDENAGGEFWGKDVSSLVTVASAFQKVFVADSDGVIRAFDGASSTPVWENHDLAYRRLTNPVVLGTSIAVADFEGYVHFLAQSDGRLIGRLRVDSEGVRSPLITENDILYVYGNGGKLAAIQLRDN